MESIQFKASRYSTPFLCRPQEEHKSSFRTARSSFHGLYWGKAEEQKKDLKRKKKEEVRLLEYLDSALAAVAENKPKPTEAALQTLILYVNLVATGRICKNKRVVEEAAKSPSRKALVSTRGTPILQPRWA